MSDKPFDFKKTVLTQHEVQRSTDHVYFENEREDHRVGYYMPASSFEKMGSPAMITVSVEVGNTMPVGDSEITDISYNTEDYGHFGYDNKYGKVTLEHGKLNPGEPVVVFRGQDAMLPKVMMYYHLFCAKAGSPRWHLDIIMDSLEKIQKWQRDNNSKIRVPNSANYFRRKQKEANQ